MGAAALVAALPAFYNIGKDIGTQFSSGPKRPKGGVYTNIPTSYPADALQNYLLRAYAANINQQPPSFGEYVGSGGKATFPFIDPGMTPNESAELGFTAPQGGTVPYYTPGQGQLSVEQQLYTAGELLKQHRLQDYPYLHRLFTAHQSLQKRAKGLDTKIARHPRQTEKNQTRKQKRDALLDRYFAETGGHSIA